MERKGRTCNQSEVGDLRWNEFSLDSNTNRSCSVHLRRDVQPQTTRVVGTSQLLVEDIPRFVDVDDFDILCVVPFEIEETRHS